DHEQGWMFCAVHGCANFRNPANHAGGSFVMYHHHGLQSVLAVSSQAIFRFGRISTAPPITWDIFHLNPMFLRHLLPLRREMPSLKHEHAVTRAQSIHNGRFPGARTGGGKHDYRPPRLENSAQSFQNFFSKLREFRAAMIDYRAIHGAEHAIRDVGGTGNLEKMT